MATVSADGWRRSSYCHNGECIEVDVGNAYVRLRIRTDKIEPELLIATREEWAAFIAGVKAGEFG